MNNGLVDGKTGRISKAVKNMIGGQLLIIKKDGSAYCGKLNQLITKRFSVFVRFEWLLYTEDSLSLWVKVKDPSIINELYIDKFTAGSRCFVLESSSFSIMGDINSIHLYPSGTDFIKNSVVQLLN